MPSFIPHPYLEEIILLHAVIFCFFDDLLFDLFHCSQLACPVCCFDCVCVLHPAGLKGSRSLMSEDIQLSHLAVVLDHRRPQVDQTKTASSELTEKNCISHKHTEKVN